MHASIDHQVRRRTSCDFTMVTIVVKHGHTPKPIEISNNLGHTGRPAGRQGRAQDYKHGYSKFPKAKFFLTPKVYSLHDSLKGLYIDL